MPELPEKKTGIWVYLTLASIVMLAGIVALLRERQSQEAALARQTPPTFSQAPVVPPPAASAAVPSTKPAAGLVKNISDNTFDQEVKNSSKPVLVDFWATWCGPCRMFGPIVDQVADDYKGRLKVCRVDVDQNPGLSQAFQVRAIPTSLLFKNGKVVKMWVGLVSGDDLKVEVDKVVKKPKKTKLVKS